MAPSGWESAVVVRVPVLDRSITALRRRFDFALKPNGIPPHITLIVPFLPRAELGEHGELPALRGLCAQQDPFTVSFTRTARFPRVLYLDPEPAGPFIALTRALTARWPRVEPYAGEHRQLIPHLTVTTARPSRVFDAVDEALRPQLPVTVQVDAAQLYLFDGRRWSPAAELPFRGR